MERHPRWEEDSYLQLTSTEYDVPHELSHVTEFMADIAAMHVVESRMSTYPAIVQVYPCSRI